MNVKFFDEETKEKDDGRKGLILENIFSKIRLKCTKLLSFKYPSIVIS